MQKRQKIVPNPAISSATVARRSATPETPSERARIRAAAVAQQQRDDRIRTEAMRAPISPAPTLRDELTQQRRREIGAPMATMVDPLDGLGNSLIDLWARISTPLMFAVWSIGCFALGRLS